MPSCIAANYNSTQRSHSSVDTLKDSGLPQIALWGHVSHCTGHTNLSSGAKPAMEQLYFTITATKPSGLVVTLSKPVIV